MSEYWKSTPKYWCKHCKNFVRDTKLERTNHDATPKHQGNLKRFLRNLHRENEKEGKDKERAKAEIARLNGISTGNGGASSSSSAYRKCLAASLPKPQATPAQRKQQLAQLAETGISIPDEFRPDMAMAGEWQVTSERIIEEGDGERKPDAIALGVRKRPVDEEDEEALEAKKARWGRAYKTQPGGEDDGDLDNLLTGTFGRRKEAVVKGGVKEEEKAAVKEDPEGQTSNPDSVGATSIDDTKLPIIKKEDSEGDVPLPTIEPPTGLSTKLEGEEEAVPWVVFKKRKAKNIRQK